MLTTPFASTAESQYVQQVRSKKNIQKEPSINPRGTQGQSSRIQYLPSKPLISPALLLLPTAAGCQRAIGRDTQPQPNSGPADTPPMLAARQQPLDDVRLQHDAGDVAVLPARGRHEEEQPPQRQRHIPRRTGEQGDNTNTTTTGRQIHARVGGGRESPKWPGSGPYGMAAKKTFGGLGGRVTLGGGAGGGGPRASSNVFE